MKVIELFKKNYEYNGSQDPVARFIVNAILNTEIYVDVEKIRKIIIDKELMPKVCEDSGQAEWTVGESQKLAEAIVDRIFKDNIINIDGGINE